MVLKCPNIGEPTSKQTQYPSVELREMLQQAIPASAPKGSTKTTRLSVLLQATANQMQVELTVFFAEL